MSAKPITPASLDRLRQQLATAEATAENLRHKIAAHQAKLDGSPPPVSGLDLLWKTALPIARTRSSKIQCRTEWNRIPKDQRPTVQFALDCLKIWNRCEEWKKDGNTFVPALHRWIKNRQWENLPESSRYDPLARYRKADPAPPPLRTDEDQAALREFLKLPRTTVISDRQ